MNLRLPLALVAVLSLSAAAHADTFSFSANGTAGGFSGSGTLMTTNDGNGIFTITDVTGPGVTGFIANGGLNNNDNLLTPDGTSLVDATGFSFTDAMGSTDYNVNISSQSPGLYQVILEDNDGNDQTLPITFGIQNTTAAVTPEPSAMVLCGTGLLGVAGLLRKRRS